MILPSKELLSEVIDVERTINRVAFIEKWNTIIYYVNGGNERTINIYELAHKCKEWAISQGYQFRVYYQCDGAEEWCIGKCGYGWDAFKCESIFEACQWILDNKEIK